MFTPFAIFLCDCGVYRCVYHIETLANQIKPMDKLQYVYNRQKKRRQKLLLRMAISS